MKRKGFHRKGTAKILAPNTKPVTYKLTFSAFEDHLIADAFEQLGGGVPSADAIAGFIRTQILQACEAYVNRYCLPESDE